MDKEVDTRLKELYHRIHRGYTLTMRDLLFLSEHDPECYVRIYRHIVLEKKADETKQLPAPVKQEELCFSTPYIHRVDTFARMLQNLQIEEDLVVGIKGTDVLDLIQEEAHPSVVENRYQYFNSYEPESVLNATV